MVPIPPPDCVDTAGVYTVPVPADLAPYASFSVDSVRFCGGSSVELSYTLPATLLGDGVDLSFQGALEPVAGALSLSGSNGIASCSQVGSSWTCQERLSGLRADTEQLNQLSEGLPAAEARARLDIAARFLTDPIGALTFDVP